MKGKEMKLIVGGLSTWSMRAWMCARLADMEVEEIVIPLGADAYKEKLKQYSSTGLVPVLIDGDLVVHDSLAIAEYLNELSGGRLYPTDKADRAIARSLCAELHSGFTAVRTNCPFTMGNAECNVSSDILQPDLDRLSKIFSQAKFGFMFDTPSVVDVFYAVMAKRLYNYGIVFDGKAGQYQQFLLDWDLLQSALGVSTRWQKEVN